METSTDNVEYCRDLLRRQDRDRYLASLFAPDNSRPLLWGLYAFNHEISRIRDLVKEPAAGEIRLAWWTEAIEAIYAGAAVDHPVARTLAQACRTRRLPKQAFVDLIEARRLGRYADPMPCLEDLEHYLAATSSAVVRLATMILDQGNPGRAFPAAHPAALAYGLVGVLRALPFQRAKGACFLPRDTLARHGLEPRHVLSGLQDQRMNQVLAELRLLAIRRLLEARSLSHLVSSLALPAFLPLALVEAYAAKLSGKDFDALTTVAEISPVMRLFRLWRAARTGTF